MTTLISSEGLVGRMVRKLFPELTPEGKARGERLALEHQARRIQHIGNGVWTFEFSRQSFPRELSKFLGEHSELELVTFASDGSGNAQAEYGHFYIVVFREKK